MACVIGVFVPSSLNPLLHLVPVDLIIAFDAPIARRLYVGAKIKRNYYRPYGF